MPSIKKLEIGAAPLFANLNKKNVYEAARNLAREVDKVLDSTYGDRRSEELQAQQISIMQTFAQVYCETLKEDWQGRELSKKELEQKREAEEEKAKEIIAKDAEVKPERKKTKRRRRR